MQAWSRIAEPRIAGAALRRLRAGAEIGQRAVAAAMSVAPSRVAHLERQAEVSEDAERRYLEALRAILAEGSPTLPYGRRGR